MKFLDTGCIAEFESVVDAENLVNLINQKVEEKKTSFFIPGQTTERRKNTYIFWNQMFFDSCAELASLYTNTVSAIHEKTKEYKEEMKIDEQLYPETFMYVKYDPSDRYDRHYDGGTASHRSVSSVLYLNDDFEGGELEFVNQKIKTRPKPGTLLIFPANYAFAHIAHPVISGNKLIITAFYNDFKTDVNNWHLERFKSL